MMVVSCFIIGIRSDKLAERIQLHFNRLRCAWVSILLMRDVVVIHVVECIHVLLPCLRIHDPASAARRDRGTMSSNATPRVSGTKSQTHTALNPQNTPKNLNEH